MRKIAKQKLELLDNSITRTNYLLALTYRKQAKSILNQAEKLYLKLEADGNLSVADLYRQDRYYALMGDINKKLRRLGVSEVKILNDGMLDLYNKALLQANPFAFVDETKVQEVIDQVWCSDGKRWSDRIWNHKSQLQQSLSDGLMNCVIQGASHDKLTRELRDRFNMAEHQSEAIVRTELNRIQNRAAAQGYLDAGYEMYEILHVADDRTCHEICEDMAGQVFFFSEAKEGENFPPFHTNCRGNIVGYKPKE